MPNYEDSLKKLVIKLYLEGKSTKEILQHSAVICSRSNVNRWIARYENGGEILEALATKPRPGRPRKTISTSKKKKVSPVQVYDQSSPPSTVSEVFPQVLEVKKAIHESVPPMPEEARNQAYRNVACRLCDKAASPKKRFLFKEWRDKKVNTLIENVIGIKMKYHQELSNAICEACYEKLSSYDGFVKCVLANQVLFSQNLQQVVYEVVPINRLKPTISVNKKAGRKPKHELDIIESYIEDLKSKKRKKAAEEIGTIRVKPPEELQANPKSRGISTPKPPFSVTTFEKPTPATSIQSIYIKEELVDDDKLTEDGNFPDSFIPMSGPSLPSELQTKTKTPWCEISAVRSYSSQSGRSFQLSGDSCQENHDDSNDSDIMILEDVIPAKKPKLSRTEDEISCKLPNRQAVTLEPIIGPCRVDIEMLVKQEKPDDLLDEQPLMILPDPLTSETMPIQPIRIKEEVDLENGALPNVLQKPSSSLNAAPTKPVQAIAKSPKPAVANSEAEKQMKLKQKQRTRIFKPAGSTEAKVTSNPANNDNVSCLPCYRCKKDNESYLNLLYHHMNNCSPEVPEEDPDPPLALLPESLKEQCAQIKTDETTLLRKIYLEINECMKNYNTLRDYYRRMINLTKPVLLAYCEKYNIKLEVEIKKSNKVRETHKRHPKNVDNSCSISGADVPRSTENCEVVNKDKHSNKKTES